MDNGANYTLYNPPSSYTPAPLNGNKKIVIYTETIFDDGCDLTVVKKLDVSNAGGFCIGYNGFSLLANYDEDTGLFSLEKTGNEEGLIENTLLWTIGGANPFDENNSGIPYTAPVKGEGLFIARWKIKHMNCPELILNAMAWGKGCIKVCNFDDIPMPQVTLIACCDDCPTLSLAITCVNRTLTITGYVAGSTITWTGPNGFTASGDVVVFPSTTPSGVFTATIVNGQCTNEATYNYTKPNAGTPVSNPIIV
jgi:hypothetical protein